MIDVYVQISIDIQSWICPISIWIFLVEYGYLDNYMHVDMYVYL